MVVNNEGNSTLLSCRSWNCELVGRYILFLVFATDSARFEFLAVTCSSSSLCNENDAIMHSWQGTCMQKAL